MMNVAWVPRHLFSQYHIAGKFSRFSWSNAKLRKFLPAKISSSKNFEINLHHSGYCSRGAGHETNATMMNQNYPIVSPCFWVPPSSFTSKQDEYYQHNVDEYCWALSLAFHKQQDEYRFSSVPHFYNNTMNIYCFVQLQ